MKELFRILKKHPAFFGALILLGFVMPLIAVHMLFKITTTKFFQANWSAGDALAFVIGFESVLATSSLGYASYCANRNAQRNNERLSREYNHLQEISIQRLLPVFKISALEVALTTSDDNAGKADKFPPNIIEAYRRSSQGKHSDFVRVFLHNGHNDGLFLKKIHLTLENVSEGIIREIRFDRIEFGGFKLPGNDEEIPIPKCAGNHEHEYLSGLWAPKESLNFCIEVYFCDERFRNFWEHYSNDRIGVFCICLYMTNTTIAGVQFHEKVDIEYCAWTGTEKIMHGMFEPDANERHGLHDKESNK